MPRQRSCDPCQENCTDLTHLCVPYSHLIFYYLLQSVAALNYEPFSEHTPKFALLYFFLSCVVLTCDWNAFPILWTFRISLHPLRPRTNATPSVGPLNPGGVRHWLFCVPPQNVALICRIYQMVSPISFCVSFPSRLWSFLEQRPRLPHF